MSVRMYVEEREREKRVRVVLDQERVFVYLGIVSCWIIGTNVAQGREKD